MTFVQVGDVVANLVGMHLKPKKWKMAQVNIDFLVRFVHVGDDAVTHILWDEPKACRTNEGSSDKSTPFLYSCVCWRMMLKPIFSGQAQSQNK